MCLKSWRPNKSKMNQSHEVIPNILWCRRIWHHALGMHLLRPQVISLGWCNLTREEHGCLFTIYWQNYKIERHPNNFTLSNTLSQHHPSKPKHTMGAKKVFAHATLFMPKLGPQSMPSRELMMLTAHRMAWIPLVTMRMTKRDTFHSTTLRGSTQAEAQWAGS